MQMARQHIERAHEPARRVRDYVWPVELEERRHGSRQAMEELGVDRSLELLGHVLRNQFAVVDTAVQHTAGFEGLGKCYPHDGLSWLSVGTQEAQDMIAGLVAEWFGSEVARTVDCRPLHAGLPKRERPYGHLGSHPTNMAAALASESSRHWRYTQYVDLW